MQGLTRPLIARNVALDALPSTRLANVLSAPEQNAVALPRAYLVSIVAASANAKLPPLAIAGQNDVLPSVESATA